MKGVGMSKALLTVHDMERLVAVHSAQCRPELEWAGVVGFAADSARIASMMPAQQKMQEMIAAAAERMAPALRAAEAMQAAVAGFGAAEPERMAAALRATEAARGVVVGFSAGAERMARMVAVADRQATAFGHMQATEIAKAVANVTAARSWVEDWEEADQTLRRVPPDKSGLVREYLYCLPLAVALNLVVTQVRGKGGDRDAACSMLITLAEAHAAAVAKGREDQRCIQNNSRKAGAAKTNEPHTKSAAATVKCYVDIYESSPPAPSTTWAIITSQIEGLLEGEGITYAQSSIKNALLKAASVGTISLPSTLTKRGRKPSK